MKIKTLIIISLLNCISKPAFSEPKFQIDEDKSLEIIQMVQLFNTTTFNFGYGSETRNDTFIRRGRIGFQGNIKKELTYKIIFAYDNLGKDGKTKLAGLAQSTENLNFNLFDAFFSWELYPKLLNMTFGYLRPQIGRESITAAFEVNSFEKAMTNFYLRPHLVGRANGRETGINLGGLYLGDFWSVNYNIGFFDTNHEKITGGSNDSKNGSKKWSPLLTGRTSITLGDPEMDKYKLSYNINYFGKRKGLTFGLNYSTQGNTDIFNQNNILGFDILANYNNLNFDAEYDIMSRTKQNNNNYSDFVFHIRSGYNIFLTKEWILEPTIMYSQAIINTNSSLGLPSEQQIDVGLNWYLNKNTMKLSSHFIQRKETNKQAINIFNLGCQLIY